MNSLRTILSTSAFGALLSLGLLSCGSPVVGLECRDGYERCGLACYDLQTDNAHCGSCGNSCGEGLYCALGVCEEGFPLEDGGIGHHRDGGDAGDGGFDMDARIGDGSVTDGSVDMDASKYPDGSFVGPDGRVFGPDGGPLDPPTNIPDGSTILPDGRVLLPDGGDFDPNSDGGPSFNIPDGAVILPDGAILLPDGGFFDPDAPPVPPPICTGPGSDPTCVCGLGTTKCGLTCVNLLTDHDNCGMCGLMCAADQYCNGTSGCALVCTPPLTLCNGQCVDFSNDDSNCGSCGNICGGAAACIYDSVLMTGACVGEAVGHIVVIGHDMSVVTRPIRQMVGNAVFLAPRNPVRVLTYDAQTDVLSRAGVSLAIQQSSLAIGRAYSLTTADPTKVTQQLGDADVLVIEPQQSALDLDLQTLGAGWSAALDTFLFRGGVVLLFEGGTNNNGTYQILSSATSQVSPSDPIVHSLFESTGPLPLSQRVLTLRSAADAIGAAVPTEYQSQGVTNGFVGVNPRNATTVKTVIQDVMPTTGGGPPVTNLPVVIHVTTR